MKFPQWVQKWMKTNPPETKVSTSSVEKAIKTEVSRTESDILKLKYEAEKVIAMIMAWKESSSFRGEYARFYYYTHEPYNIKSTRGEIQKIEQACARLLNFNQKVKNDASTVERELQLQRGKGDILTKKEIEALDICFTIDKEIQKASADLENAVKSMELAFESATLSENEPVVEKMKEMSKEKNEYLALTVSYLSDAKKVLESIVNQLARAVEMQAQILQKEAA